MLSDEEKQVVEWLKQSINEYNDIFQGKIEDESGIKRMKTIKNLIEKQSKEIEELKAISEYREKIIKGLGLKTLPKTITGFKELIENNDKKWEDKIKAKIEEVHYKMCAHQDVREAVKQVLQSLLEKE